MLASSVPPAVRYAARKSKPRSRLPPPNRLYRTASLTGVPSELPNRMQTSTSARSMAARSAVHATAAALVIRLVELESSVGFLHETLHSRLGACDILGCGAKILDPFLEQLERARQIELLTVQLRGNLLEAREPLLE